MCKLDLYVHRAYLRPQDLGLPLSYDTLVLAGNEKWKAQFKGQSIHSSKIVLRTHLGWIMADTCRLWYKKYRELSAITAPKLRWMVICVNFVTFMKYHMTDVAPSRKSHVWARWALFVNNSWLLIKLHQPLAEEVAWNNDETLAGIF